MTDRPRDPPDRLSPASRSKGEETAATEDPTVQSQLQAVLDGSDDAIVAKRLDGTVTSWNAGASQMFGYSAAEMLGRSIECIYPADRLDEMALFMEAIARGRSIERMPSVRLHRCGAQVHVMLSIRPLQNEQGKVIGALNVARNITERVEAEKNLHREKYYDALTALPNGRMFAESLQMALGRHEDPLVCTAVLLIDLDRTRGINDSLSRAHGDSLLGQTAERIREVVGADAMLARVGSDQFAVLLPGLGAGAELGALAERIRCRIKDTFQLLEHQRDVTARIATAVAPGDGVTPEELMQHAAQALQHAKRRGGNCVQAFTSTLGQQAQRRIRLQNDLRVALEHSQFEVHYQPILGLRDGSLQHCEALLRWRHPDLGLVSPAEFIPIAEESGLIVPIGHWVFLSAVRQMCDWHARLGTWVHVAVNLSPVQLQAPDGYLRQWVRTLQEHGVPVGAIVCEITEGVMVAPSEDTTRRLRMLQDAGIELAVDDFGTGYSNFSKLARMVVNKLKIDQSLIRDMEHATRTLEVCRTIVNGAHALGMTVVAEGVETLHQQSLTEEIGCDFVQGYLVCRPGPASVVEGLFNRLPPAASRETAPTCIPAC